MTLSMPNSSAVAPLSGRSVAPLPLAPAHTIVCRDDLLFEIELDAMKNLLDKAVVYA